MVRSFIEPLRFVSFTFHPFSPTPSRYERFGRPHRKLYVVKMAARRSVSIVSLSSSIK